MSAALECLPLALAKRKTVKRLQKQVFCSECGAVRISHAGSLYAVCPNGHGRLVPRFSKSEAKQAFAAALPRARRVGRNRFTIDGHEGLFCYRQRSGLRPVQPSASVAPDEVIACRVAKKRRLIRVFARKPVPTKSGGDGAS